MVCLSLLGAGAALSSGSGPAVAAAPSPVGATGPVHYVIGTPQEAEQYVLNHLTDPMGNQTSSTSWYQSSPRLVRPMVLAGDSITWHEAVGMTESGGNAVYSPNAQSWAVSPYATPIGDYTRITLDLPPDTSRDCAAGPPAQLHSNTDTLGHAWCRGPLVYTASLLDATADDHHMIWGMSVYDSTGATIPPKTDRFGVLLAGPDNGFPGRSETTAEHVYVLDPSLALTKQVCVEVDVADCDVTDDSLWVDSTEIPAGSPQAVFRVTVTNTGNIELLNVHIADDYLTPATADVAKVGLPTVAGGPAPGALFAASLEPDESASLVVTVPIDGTLVGLLKNTVTANGEIPDEIPDAIFGFDDTIDPYGERLSKRFTGNPTPGHPDGEPEMVPSNQDVAQVYERYPAITLEKWVCQAGTGCTEPTGADLTSLGSGTPTGGWVKATTVTLLTDAQWLLVITNTGTVALTDVTLSREDFAAGGASGYGTTTDECAEGTNLGRLEVAQSVTVVCSTAEITNTEAWDSGENVVNTAQVTAYPESPILSRDGQPPVVTAESSAQVNTTVLPGEVPPGEVPPGPGPKLPLLGLTGAEAVGAAVVGAVFLLTGTGLVVARTLRARRLTAQIG